MPLIETKGAASAQGFGEFAKTSVATYIEDVFSTYLYTGNGSTQTITNGIDLSTKGGMLWIKRRDDIANSWVVDTVRGNTKGLYTQTSAMEITSPSGNDVTGFTSTGFSLGTNNQANINTNAGTYVSWTFREQPKFFDVVTYTGNGTNRTIAHNLGSVPGCIIVKRLSGSVGSWATYHRSLANTEYVFLNSTVAKATDTTYWNSTTPTATEFSLGTSGNVNGSGGTYVAYLFAHDAGGFGLTGTDNVISCGSYTGNGSATGPVVSLGYEPQFLIVKRASGGTSSWFMYDTMRGLTADGTGGLVLYADLTNAEASSSAIGITSTGFQIKTSSPSFNNNTDTYIYIAIRRGPMKTPTSGTSVYSPTRATFSGTTVTDTGFVVDMVINKVGTNTTNNNFVFDRLRGANNSTGQYVLPSTSSTSAETATSGYMALTGTVTIQNGFLAQDTTANNMVWAFRRAPGFFDEVCYTGNGASTQTITHNLTVSPQLIIAKKRSATGDWGVYASGQTDGGLLNSADGFNVSNRFAAVGATTFDVKAFGTPSLNDSGATYVAYLFASCPGVSKVGSYTGTGALQTINCGFTGGARFVLIKRTDSTGDWFTYDSARGITSGNDPYLLLNSTAAEVTGTNYVDTTSVGFQVTAAAPAGLNASGGTYIFLAIA